MAFINNRKDIKERRVKYFIDKLYFVMTKLLVLDNRAYSLIDETAESNYIATRSQNPSDSYPLLPLGTEEVLNWDSLNFNMQSLKSSPSIEYIISIKTFLFGSCP